MPHVVYKPVSMTPLEMVTQFRQEKGIAAGVPVGYAGRLDPMAEGLLLLLVGDENKDRKAYESMEKEYEFQILFGLETDSYDLMGLITDQSNNIQITQEQIQSALKPFIGTWEQSYPPYSSAAVQGKPLYWWTRQGRLSEIEIPKKSVTVNRLELKKLHTISDHQVASKAVKRIQNVQGDFRQEEIIKQFQIVVTGQNMQSYLLADCIVVCASGTYVRGLAHSLGRALKTPALAYSIKRTRIGEFTVPLQHKNLYVADSHA